MKSQNFSLARTPIILLIAFGAAVAAGVPLHPAVAQVTMLIGLAVGVDYAMFLSSPDDVCTHRMRP